MKSMFLPVVMMTANASGAVKAAKQGDAVAIVDVIDMSTTLETGTGGRGLSGVWRLSGWVESACTGLS